MAIPFEAGQIWRALGRAQDGEVHVAVLDVIDDPQLGQICSIAAMAAHIRNRFPEGGLQPHPPHAPVTAEVLRAAVTELVETGGPTARHPHFAEAYQQWRTPFDAGEAGLDRVRDAIGGELVELPDIYGHNARVRAALNGGRG